MAEENVLAEVMNMPPADLINVLEAEPTNLPAAAPGPDIPALRHNLAILVSTGECKEAIGVNLTHEQVRRLEEKDVMRHYKVYEAYVGKKTNKTMISGFLSLSVKTLGTFVRIKDPEALHNELKNDFVIKKELSSLSGAIALGCGRLLAFANAIVITLKHIGFSDEEPHHPSRDSDGYPLAGQDEVDNA